MQLAGSTKSQSASDIPTKVIEGHYKYSTQFLWPLMHGFSDLPNFDEIDRNCYRSLNLVLATYLNWSENSGPCHLHNYQHALIPLYLSRHRAESSHFFWGIAWAERFAKDFEQHAEEIARSLLCCETVSFHTSEDMHNFAGFVRRAIAEVKVTASDRLIIHASGRSTQLLVTPEALHHMYGSHAA
jgi:trehalose-6-phosphate synthase